MERKAMSNYEIWELSLKTLALVGIIVGAIWAVFKYNDTKEKEFYSYYWNQKFELFRETSKVASQMATTESLPEFNSARSTYFELFYGRLSLVEGDPVKQAMKKFKPLVPLEDEPNLPRKELEQPAYKLTIALKKELLESWKDPFSELKSGTEP